MAPKIKYNKKDRFHKVTLKGHSALPDGPVLTNGHWLVTMTLPERFLSFDPIFEVAPDGRWIEGATFEAETVSKESIESIFPKDLSNYKPLSHTCLAGVEVESDGKRRFVENYRGDGFLTCFNSDYLSLFVGLEMEGAGEKLPAILKLGETIVGLLMPCLLDARCDTLERVLLPPPVIEEVEKLLIEPETVTVNAI